MNKGSGGGSNCVSDTRGSGSADTKEGPSRIADSEAVHSGVIETSDAFSDISTSIGVKAKVLAGAVYVRCAYNNETQSFKGCDR